MRHSSRFLNLRLKFPGCILKHNEFKYILMQIIDYVRLEHHKVVVILPVALLKLVTSS